MAAKLVFTYFDVPALGEQVRLALAMTGQPWEDKRISFDDFKELKPRGLKREPQGSPARMTNKRGGRVNADIVCTERSESYAHRRRSEPPTATSIPAGRLWALEYEMKRRRGWLGVTALPFKQLPSLEVDGKAIPQSLSQLRYAGKIGGIYPTNHVEAAYADATVDTVTDMHFRLAPSLQEKDHTKKLKLRKDLAETYLPLWLGNLEKFLEAAGGIYFAGNKLSIGDIAVVARLNWLKDGTLEGIPTTIVDKYPLLLELVGRVMSEPKIVAYMKNAPRSTMQRL